MSSTIAELRRYLTRHWQACTAYVLLFVTLSGLLVYKLGSLVGGYSTSEQTARQAASSLQEIWNNPFHAPYDLLVHAVQYLAPDNLLAGRLASVLLGWLTIVLFCILVYRWHGTRTAIMATLLFGTSSWFLHIARLGTTEVVLFGFFALVFCGIILREKKTGWPVFGVLLLSALLLYTPGMVWFLLLGFIWQLPTIDKAFKKNPLAVVMGTMFFLAVLAPLIWHFYQHPAAIIDWLCLPDTWKQPFHLLANVLQVPLAVFLRQPAENPQLWLGRLPVLSVFGSTMFALGAYVYWRHVRLMRVRILAALGIFGSIIIGLSDGLIGLSILVPFIYLVAAAGIGYLTDIWLEVFPRNPLARYLGLAIAALALAFACSYNLRSYFTAWPQATVTRQIFIVKPQ